MYAVSTRIIKYKLIQTEDAVILLLLNPLDLEHHRHPSHQPYQVKKWGGMKTKFMPLTSPGGAELPLT